MNIGLPVIEIHFKQLGVTAVPRSAKGVVALILKDDTDKAIGLKSYQSIDEVMADKAKYTADNYAALVDVFLDPPSKLMVARIDVAKTAADGLALLKNQAFNYLAIISATPADHTAVASWVKSENINRIKRIKGITWQATVTDDMHLINLINSKVKRKSDTAEIDGWKYLGRLSGILAGLSLKESATNHKLKDLEYVVDVASVETEIGKGNLVLMNDEGEVCIARGVNTLQTITSGMTDDMKFIAIVEGMDLTYEDIKRMFKDNYVGKLKNSPENQMLFMSSVNAYFRELAKEEVMDKDYPNRCFIDVDALRDAWASIGKDVSHLKDDAVKRLTFRTALLMGGDVKYLNAMEDMKFTIGMQ